ncbi:MAG: Ig-like domain-containing protein [Mycobacteriales bacterium]
MTRADDGSGLPGDDVTGHSLRLPVPAVAPTLVRLSSSQPGVPEGAVLALAAQVVTVAGADVPPATGEVAFLVGGRRIGVAALDAAGQAVLNGVRLPVGVHAVVASYSGDALHAAGSSAPLPQAITAAATPVVVLVGSPTSTPEGVVVDAEVVDPHTGRLAEDAEGEVVFRSGGSVVGAVPLQSGLARLVIPVLPPGRLQASFTGDREHAAAEGSLGPEVVRDCVANIYPDAP